MAHTLHIFMTGKEIKLNSRGKDEKTNYFTDYDGDGFHHVGKGSGRPDVLHI